jgi:hypothetical protein
MALDTSLSHGISAADPGAGRQAYENVLLRLCSLAEVAPADHDVVLSREAIILGGVVLALQFEPWSNFIKVFIEVGKPVESEALAFYRWVLAQHLVMPAPFSMVAALHPDTEQVILYGSSPMPDSPEADQGFLAFLQGCVHVCQMLRNPEGLATLETVA